MNRLATRSIATSRTKLFLIPRLQHPAPRMLRFPSYKYVQSAGYSYGTKQLLLCLESHHFHSLDDWLLGLPSARVESTKDMALPATAERASF